MRPWVFATASMPTAALAHGPGPVGHAHPHGLEIALIALALVAAAALGPRVLRAIRKNRGERE